MARNVAPTKTTGGGGFEFEDKVIAFFVCHLLLIRPPLQPNFGIISKISLQVRVDGLLLDDLLLRLNNGEKEKLCAFSIKSNTQFSKTSAPSEFVQDAWEQYLGEIDSVFNKDKDRLGIITTPLDTDTKRKLEGLLNKARSQDSAELSKRIDEEGYVSKEAISIFKSFSCPKPLADKYSIDESSTGNLLRCIEHLDFDFENTSSKDKNRAISMLKEILDEGSVGDAENLWDTLCSIARKIRSDGGDIDLGFIVARLRSRYRLKDFPDYVPVWKKIKQKTRDALDLIPDKIADDISIDRSAEITEIIEKLHKHRFVVLLGESGCGKTVIEKTIAELEYDTSKVVWVNAETIPLLQELPSLDIFGLVTDNTALLVIDGIDRFYEFDQLALLLKTCNQASETSPWKIIISSQPDDWARVQFSLSRLNVKVDFEQHIVENPKDKALTPVWTEYPALKNLSLHLHLRSFLFKPKVLDLFARKVKEGADFDAESFGRDSKIGESHLISWYWEHEVEYLENGLRKSVLLKRIAEKLADDLTHDITASNFSQDELALIQELVKSRILVNRSERISFEHDIIADWARLLILLDKSLYVSDYLVDRLSSPLWCRAFRLVGTHLLEVGANITDWKQLFDSFLEEEEKGNLAQDLLLEASIFSSDPQKNLNKLWTELIKHDGRLLRRLLIRFQYSASLPNRIALIIASQYPEDSMSELIAQNRDPYWLYWYPMLLFLYSHKEDVIRLGKRQLAEIVDKWLRFSKNNWSCRKEASEMALDIAEDELALNISNVRCLDKTGMVRYAYRAGIAAYNEFQERALDFILTACSRKAPSGRILELVSSYNEKERLEREQAEKKRSKEDKKRLAEMYAESPLPFEQGPTPPPWPDGPLDHVDQDFHKLCIESDSDADILYPLIRSNPQKAREVILALLIEHPHPKDLYGPKHDEYTGMVFIHGWFPPFYTRGPFYFFLNTQPEIGVNLIVTLINFATERWAEERYSEDSEPPYIEIPLPSGKKKFIGDALVYYWHRDVGAVSHIIPSALMALEKWLYDTYGKEDSKSKSIYALEKILESGTSLAFVGLLILFGKKNPELFVDTLLPLLSIPEFYAWDYEHIIKSEGHQMMGWFGKGEYLWKAAQKFNSMEHRKHSISMLAPRIFTTANKTRESFATFRQEWVNRYENGNIGSVSTDVFINLINWFDISNWNITETSEGIKFEFKMPDEIVEERKAGLKDMQDRQLLIFSPLDFRQLLDGKKEIAQFKADHVWDTIQQVEGIKLPQDDPDIGIMQKENSVCGGIAVLFKFYRDWLNQNPDNKSWCITRIVELILNPPTDESFDSEVSHANWVWDRYCAEIMPILWAEEPENTVYRRCMAILAINKHYETVGILFRATAELRRDLGDHFKQLTNFLIDWTHARWKFYREQYAEKKSFNVDKWIEKEVALFEKGGIPSTQMEWADIAKDEIDKRTKLYEKERKRRGGNWRVPKEEYFDFMTMKAAFSWMPTLDQALSPSERVEWLRFWKQAISWTISVLEREEDGEISETPSEWDRWVFEQMATQIFHMEDSENPNELWQPILDLGAEGHYWVDDFIMELFLKGIGYDPIPRSFTKRWKEILEYAFASEKWSSSRSGYWYYRNKLWCELLGMNYIVSNLWDKEKSSIVNEMKPYYERWAKDFLSDAESATYFIHFLQKPATIDMLLDALVWLDNASDESGETFFTDRHHDVQKPLANLLEMTWKKQKDDIKRNPTAYKAFMNLLEKLINLQNLQAMEIQKNLPM